MQRKNVRSDKKTSVANTSAPRTESSGTPTRNDILSSIPDSEYNLIRSHRLALPRDDDLIDELMNVRLRETSPGVYRMDHDPGRHDDRAIALALAAIHAEEQFARWRAVDTYVGSF